MLLPALRRACADGVLASLFSGLALLRGSRSDLAHLVGRSEYRVGRPPLRSAATDIALHTATAVVWGALYDRMRALRRRPTHGNAVLDALLLTGVAAGLDRVVAPPLLTPGADRHATAAGTRPPSMLSLMMVYGGFAAGLAIGGMVALRRREVDGDDIDDDVDDDVDIDDGWKAHGADDGADDGFRRRLRTAFGRVGGRA
ncbi:hypothetical protein CDN99_07645 [Roseateles aquatilis]|uniref:Uncharacterized protein n=1 Tax=Roseateles aquatilis TaxID=431061 RepID=A0A246JI05_9BURK|nr:hypothetical protein CDN99_07645 [Roseateles aquatilis]